MQLDLETVVLTVVGLVATGAVPWAFVIERRMARLESRLCNGLNSRIGHLEDENSKIRDQLQDVRESLLKASIQ